MARYIDLDDDEIIYCGNDGEYERYNIPTDVRTADVVERNKEKWTPCSERLPEYDGEKYLVTDYCKQINRRRIHISYCYVNREGFWSDIPLGYEVIAWMPLPAPYKESEVDE